jgi:hypothetical protein
MYFADGSRGLVRCAMLGLPFRSRSVVLLLALPLTLATAPGCGSSDSQRKAGTDAGTTGGADGSGGRSGGGGTAANGGAGGNGEDAAVGGASNGGTQASGGTQSTGGARSDAAAPPSDAGHADASDGAPVLACSDYAPGQPQISPTSVRLYNNTANNIYIGSTAATCNFVIGFTLEDSHGAPLKVVADACDFTCSTLQEQGCACPPGCNVQIVTLLAPGKYKEVGWTGTIFATEKMPRSCYLDSTCDNTTCLVEQSAPTGITARASAYTAATCSGGPCVDCTPGGLGTCTIQNGQTVTGTELKGSAVWTGQSVLTINLQ